MDEILETIQSEIDSFCFEDFTDVNVEHNHGGRVIVEATIDRDAIERNLFRDIKAALKDQ